MSTRSTSVSSLESQSVDYSSPTDSSDFGDMEEPLISGLHHVNLLVPPNTLHLARGFYTGTLGLQPAAVPASCKAHLAWFDISSSGQQIHITSQHHLNQAQMKAQTESPRHPCFKISTKGKLDRLQSMIWELYERGGDGAPVYCDEPQKDDTDDDLQGPSGFPRRFFARDYAGNRLEFSL